MPQRALALEQLVERTHEGFWYIDVNARTLDVNPAMCRILDRPREEIIGRSIFDFVDEENLRVFHEEIAARRAGTRTGTYEIALQRPSGENVPCINNASSIWDDDGVRIGSIGLWTDISKLKAVESELRQVRATLEERVEARTEQLRLNEARLHEAHRIARLGSWEVDSEAKLDWSEEVFNLLGVDRETFDGTSDCFYRVVHPDDVERVKADSDYAWEHLDHYETVHRIQLPDRSVRTVRESAAVIREENGTPIRLSGTVQDITEQVEAEEKLRAAQKMEAIGQLSGGIAHDFNNLLGVIIGSAEFMEMSGSYDAELVGNIKHAAERGAELTHRMLAYARRQPLKASKFNMAEMMTGMMQVLKRSLGGKISIVFQADENLWPVLADAGQLEDALLNLSINARDAMPDGGTLTISCTNVVVDADVAAQYADATEGEFVVMSVSDTGTGMPEEVQRKATEPFFSTKGTQGSVLGLSMVYGFARQSGGNLTIDSREGFGTTIKIYLPRASSIEAVGREPQSGELVSGNNEHVMVIEDDEVFGQLVQRMLETLNYRTTRVHDAAEARAHLSNGESFDLILSDVVLPNGQSGPEFAEEIEQQRPETKTIFMSGFPAFAEQQKALIGPDRVLLSKPINRAALANAVREALSG